MIRTFTVVGGGSAYAPGLFSALVHHAQTLDLEEVRLFDTNEKHLALVTALCRRLAHAAGLGWRVIASSSLEEALHRTDAVLHTTRPGGLGARRIDETLPLEFGIPGQETVGPGGFFFALRSVPVALEIASVLERVSPRAFLLNYTNPTNIVTQALARTNVRVVGLCDQSDEDLQALGTSLGKEERASFTCTGLNHATWYGDVRFGDASFAIDGPLQTPEGLDEEHQARFELSRTLADDAPGLWPNSYLPYYTHPERFVALSRRVGPRSDVISRALPDYYRHFADVLSAERPVLLRHRGSAGFGDMAVGVLQALGRPAGQRLVLNLPNGTTTPLLDRETVGETVCEMTEGGPVPIPGPDWPSAHKPLLEQLERYQRLTAEAVVRGGESRLVDALRANPLVAHRARAQAMVTRARTLYGERLPEFA